MTTAIYTALEKRYPAPAFALFYEVANGTGWRQRRYADAIAMSLFPSRGLDLYGFEIKTDRHDWLAELKNPEKAEEICSYCDFWNVIASTDDIVKEGELPPTWGLILVKGNALRVKKQAPKLTPKPIDRPMLAALLRRAHERATSTEAMRAVKRAAYDEGLESGRKEAEVRLKNAQYEANELKKAIDQFEANSGIKLSTWDAGQIGQLVKVLRQNDLRRLKNVGDCFVQAAMELRRLADDAEKYGQAMGNAAIPDELLPR